MRGIADDGLVEVTDLDVDLALGIGHRAQVADVAVAADPDGRTFGQAAGLGFIEPVVEAQGAAAHVGVGRAGHFEVLGGFQDVLACGGTRRPRDQFFWHGDLYYLYSFFCGRMKPNVQFPRLFAACLSEKRDLPCQTPGHALPARCPQKGSRKRQTPASAGVCRGGQGRISRVRAGYVRRCRSCGCHASGAPSARDPRSGW